MNIQSKTQKKLMRIFSDLDKLGVIFGIFNSYRAVFIFRKSKMSAKGKSGLDKNNKYDRQLRLRAIL